ncbi:bifunctional 3-(3-hydroxy-phenyl)propionate/3-hydroxycinnamic acid hydroxylase [Rhizobium sp. P38BS-XIX]|uniref:bifunctional 3-(3-hydroxy-phenyl)propionate/3-hydroxycinnamic acid hydroxylase MhpA n=1 Tax=Rhizobium sp. P38BS-XIX TaxID=2726740 RepID=UPI0014567EFC|nr:bifunctional 3-(3-hydroxy-phenyl)propionate/3-hydroxycinnamic acid hydroxylase [Rhizobium sp. P38BS-XIX]NLS01275.1 bifunctional 3-(3-hydroxy-phenyl)propionate/3-hydroxycinnamic acid hydroxylase [Rhizobium sp. P38BS-XIX]
MTNISHTFEHYDVLIAGFGPAGAVAAGLLGQKGHRVLVVDRQTGIYEKPRAIAIDHEILRHFDNMGIAEGILPYTAPFTASQHFGARGQLIRRIDMVARPYPLGYTPSMVFTQPPVEAAIREHVTSLETVTVELGSELIGFRQNDTHVEARIVTSEATRTVSANYLIGCDGAWSTVREQAGLKLEDLVFDEPWLVIDIKVNEDALDKLPETSAQFCNPARPTTFVMGPQNHRRWEIMLLPGEDPREMEKPENVWKLLGPWLSPNDGQLWRAAAYRFHALVADNWRSGRVFIAGDAAHQQPPFIGQGMCQGLRDVSNLTWKLDRVLVGRSSDRLLDTYTEERKQHVVELTGKIKAIGQMICERDPVAASQRDEKALAEGGGQARTITRQEIVPPLRVGFLSDCGAEEVKGTLFPQPLARREDGSAQLLDKMTGNGWRLFLDGRRAVNGQGVPSELGLVVKTLVAPAVSGGLDTFEEMEGVLAAWFDRHGVEAVLVRPDHYVFGAARTQFELDQQLSELRDRLH